jgi:hypothetical protein
MADTTNIPSGHSHDGKGGRVGEWGKRESRGRSREVSVLPCPYTQEKDRRGESLWWGEPANPTPPPWQVGSVGVCAGGGSEPPSVQGMSGVAPSD